MQEAAKGSQGGSPGVHKGQRAPGPWQPLAWSALLSSGLGLCLLHLVGVHSVQEVLPALAVLHVLHAHADPLGQDLATNTLVDNNTNGALRDVENTSSLAMVG